jgi:hypothetical protein
VHPLAEITPGVVQKLPSFTRAMIQVLANGSCLRETKQSSNSNLPSSAGVALILMPITGHQLRMAVRLIFNFSRERVWYLVRAEAMPSQSVQSGPSRNNHEIKTQATA